MYFRSNIGIDDELVFELVTGRTALANKHNTFRLESNGTRAFIKLAKALDYEATAEYTLTVRVEVSISVLTISKPNTLVFFIIFIAFQAS